MRKIIFAITFLFALSLSAKQPTVKELQQKISANEATIKVLKDSLSGIPDTLCITALDSTFCVPTKDAQEVAIPIVDYIKETNSNGWPKTGGGWLAWLLGLVPLVFGVKKLTAINNVWKILEPYLKSRLGLAILFGGALSAVLTLVISLISKNDFNSTILMVTWPWAALFASFIHNIKSKKDAVQA
jgi:hypothetical protein